MRLSRLTALFDGSIRSRLISSFSAVALLAVVSALIAMFLMQASERQTRQMLTRTLPIVADAQALGRTIVLFASLSRDLSKVEDVNRYRQLKRSMEQGLADMGERLEELGTLGVAEAPLQEMRAMIGALRNTMLRQHELAQVFLKARQQQNSVDDRLRDQHRHFSQLIQPRIAAGYREFIEQSQDIREEISQLLNENIGQSDLQRLDNSFRIGFESLVGVAIGEMWANHEITVATFQAYSLLQEAKMADAPEQIDELILSFNQLAPIFERLQPVLAPINSDSDRVLQAALGLFEFGFGADSFFHLRTVELTARRTAAHISGEAGELARAFGEQAGLLTDHLRATAAEDSEALQEMLAMAGVIQLMLIVVVVLVSFAIGWYYVGQRLVGRIISLKTAMDQHAMGMETEIAMQGKDEVTDMARALQCFVRQRTTVETALRQSLEFLNEAQLIAKFGSCTWDEDRAEWQWSDGFYRILGFEPGEIDADEEQFLERVDSADRQKVQRFFHQVRPSARIFQLDFSLRRKDNSQCSVTTRWKYSKVRGRITGTLHGTLLDITERQKIEEELLKVKKLESIGVLAGGIAHDFNNLLTVIMGNSALARRELSPEHQVQQYLRLSENAASRARDLTKRLLTFAKGGDPIRSETNVREILVEVAEFVLHGSNVKCEFDIPDSLWSADVDAGQISQVLQNLVVNADQAMPGGGVIRIHCANVNIDAASSAPLIPGDYLRIDISDQGHGIAPENLKRVFDPYFTTREMDSTKGSGLGLAIVHSIVRKHGGSIEVDSIPGEGTTFSLHIPARPGGSLPIPTVQCEIPRRSGLVLVMDDEEMIREVAASMLEHLGYQVLLAADGDQAIECYRRCLAEGKRPDLVIMDLTVPGGLGGEKAARQLLELDGTARIIVSSGYSDDRVLIRYRDYGFCAIAAKPYRLTELSETIEEALMAEPGRISTNGGTDFNLSSAN